MTRVTDPTLTAELQQPQVQIAHLVEIRLDAADGGTQYHTDAPQDLSWNGNTYQRGRLLSLRVPEETTELKVEQLEVTVTGVDQTFVQTLLGATWMHREVIVWRCAIRDGVIVGAPMLVFSGTLDDGTLTEDPDKGESVVRWKVDSDLAKFGVPRGRRTADESQQTLSPGDRFFEFTQKVDTRVPWGRKE